MTNLTRLFPGLFQQGGKESGRVLGIDLGTTNSVVADLKWDLKASEAVQVRCLDIVQDTLAGKYNNCLVPSMAALINGRLIIGEGAKRLLAEAPAYKMKHNRDLFYDCKNDMGVKLSYLGPEGYQSPPDIAAKILKFLYQNALDLDSTPVDRVVVTVPASFQIAQRQDTIDAARQAGIAIHSGDLLDEPVAAFLDYLLNYSEDLLIKPGDKKNILVFDFGGGTCDVATFCLHWPAPEAGFHIANLSVSRYHQLGGGDLDRQIVHDILIPQLLEENGLVPYDLTFSEKKKTIEPALLGVAEGLKIKMSREIDRLIKFGHYDPELWNQIIVNYPGVTTIPVSNRNLTLTRPSLRADQFEELLSVFLDPDILYPRGNEYRMVCSVLAPVIDATNLSHLSGDEIDYCLMAGGSSLLPHIPQTIKNYFPRATILSYPDKERSQTTVAVGAAYHALSLTLRGTGLVQPVNHERICIRTRDGLKELVPAGVTLPYPAAGQYQFNNDLSVPDSVNEGSIKLRIEIVAGDEERLLMCSIWEIEGPLTRGEPLGLEYCYDENQELQLLMSVSDRIDNSQVVSFTLERPLTNVVNPNQTRQHILELDEQMRRGRLNKEQQRDTIVEIAKLHAELHEYERAVELLKAVLAGNAQADPIILNYLGIYCGELGDWDREKTFYQEAARVSSWKGPLFNLALAYRKRKDYDEAVNIMEELIQEEEGAYLVLRGLLARDQGQEEAMKAYLTKSMQLFPPVNELSHWQLGWYITAARILGDEERLTDAQQIQRSDPDESKITNGVLPTVTNLKGR